MPTAIEISMYPLSADYIAHIQAFIERLNTYEEIRVLTNSLSTQIWGPLERTMRVIAVEIERSAAACPHLVFVMKVLPGLSAP